MEPVRWGRDDDRPRFLAAHGVHAAMEPVRWGRDDGSSMPRSPAMISWPQWSPSAGDGTTSGGGWAPAPSEAAMEPVRWGRDDRRSTPTCQWRGSCRNGARPLGTGRPGRRRAAACPAHAAMEPVRWGRDDGAQRASDAPLGAAAMEPVRWGRDDSERSDTASATARPQWSPSAGDGTTQPDRHPRGLGAVAAMEPVRWGRDDPGPPRSAEPHG